MLTKLADDVRWLAVASGLAPLITATPERADRLRTALCESATATIPVHVVAVPRLLTLVGSIRAPPPT